MLTKLNRYIITSSPTISELLKPSTLEKYDPSGMHKIYDDWPRLAKEAYYSEYEPAIFENVDHIIFSGMGGSGAMGDFLSSILSKTNVHVCTVKGYTLPKTVDSKTLVITSSVSGNTEETLTVLRTAHKLGTKLIGFSSGGKMEQFCKKNKIEFRKIPLVHSPRASFPVFLYSMLRVLNSEILIKKQDILDSIQHLTKLQKTISSSNLTRTNVSLQLANWITGIPIIYYPFGLQAAAVRFKNSLQENAKLHVMIENVIESSHNGIVAWEKPSIVQPVLIEGADDYFKTKQRWKILKAYFSKHDIDYWEIRSIKSSIISKLITLIYLLDYSALYKAILSKTDPSPVESIDFMKSKL